MVKPGQSCQVFVVVAGLLSSFWRVLVIIKEKLVSTKIFLKQDLRWKTTPVYTKFSDWNPDLAVNQHLWTFITLTNLLTTPIFPLLELFWVGWLCLSWCCCWGLKLSIFTVRLVCIRVPLFSQKFLYGVTLLEFTVSWSFKAAYQK